MEPVFSDFSGSKAHFRFSKARSKRILRVLSLFKELKGCCLLDAGCGYGFVSRELARKCGEVTGVDTNRRAIDFAKRAAREKGVKNCSFLNENAERLSFGGNSFDIVVSYQVLEHVGNQKRYLKELKRVLKEDGVLYIATPNRFYPIEPHYKIPFLALMPSFLANIFVRARGVKEYDIKLLSRKKLAQLLMETGFQFEDFTGKIVRDPEKFCARKDFGLKMKFLKHFYFFPFRCFVPGFIFVCRK